MYRAFRRYLTQQRISSFLVIFAMILASCDAEDVVTDPDWCYTFNYLTNDYETNFTAGSWLSGTGFIPNGSNDLSFSYSNGQTVSAAQVVITVARPEGVTGMITGAGNGIIFGITPSISPFPLALAAELDSAELTLTAEGLSDSGTTMNISVATDKPFALESIHVRGWGVNPFPFNECPKGTPTVTASPTNVATLGPTSTGISTETGTPEATPTQGACLVPGQPSPTPAGTIGPTATPAVTTILASTAATNVTVLPFADYEIVVAGIVQWSAEPYREGDAFYISDPPGTWKTIEGGLRLFWNGALWPTTPDYSSSHTYTLYATSGSETNWTFNYADSTPGDNAGSLYLSVRLIAPTATPYPDCTATPTATPSASPTITPSRTPVTLTPTISPTPTRTPAPVIVPSQTPPPPTSPPTLVYPTLTPNPGVTNTPIPNTPAPGTPAWTGTPNMTATSLAQGTPFPGAGVNPGDGAGLIGDIGGLGTGMIGAGSNIMSRATGWMNSLTGTFTGIVNGYFYAIPQPPPSVPRCATQPMESELCAIYFFLTHTVLSGTVGSVIVPLATIVVTLVVLFAFIRLARAILGRAMEATKS